MRIPDANLCQGDTVEHLFREIYGDLSDPHLDTSVFTNRMIAAPRNRNLSTVNDLATALPGGTREYLSIDTVEGEDAETYPTEVLNDLQPSGLPTTACSSKKGSPSCCCVT